MSQKMLPPKDLYSAYVHNTTKSPQQVTVQYGNHAGVRTSEIASTVIQVGHTAYFQEKSFTVEGVTHRHYLEVVTVGDSAFKAPFRGVNSPRHDMLITISTSSSEESNDVQYAITEREIQVCVCVADGSEDIETVVPIDLLRRACGKNNVVVAKVGGVEESEESEEEDDDEPPKRVTLVSELSNGTKLVADLTLESVQERIFDLLVIPGGLGGSKIIAGNETAQYMLRKHKRLNRWIAAICAAPVIVLHPLGILKKCNSATCYPSLQPKLPDHIKMTERAKRVCVDEGERVVTSQAVGSAVEFALCCIDRLCGREKMEQVKKAIVAL